MKKIITLVVVFFVAQLGFAQKMITRSGEIKFEASMPAFEEVAANVETGKFLLLTEWDGKIAKIKKIKLRKLARIKISKYI